MRAGKNLKVSITELSDKVQTKANYINMLLAEREGRPFRAVGSDCILRRVGECGVSVGLEQRGFVGLWQPHLRAQNIAANEQAYNQWRLLTVNLTMKR